MNHLYQSSNGLIHECEGAQIGNDRDTYRVWTKCEIDVPANQSYMGEDPVTCPECNRITAARQGGKI